MMADKSRSSIPAFQQPTGANDAGLVKSWNFLLF